MTTQEKEERMNAAWKKADKLEAVWRKAKREAVEAEKAWRAATQEAARLTPLVAWEGGYDKKD